jgi:hypothetical protein
MSLRIKQFIGIAQESESFVYPLNEEIPQLRFVIVP